MFTDILAGSSFSPLPDMFLLLYVFDYTHILPVCVFSPPKAKKKKESFPSPLTRQTDSVGGRRGEQGMWALGLPIWGSQLTGERSLAIHYSSLWHPLTVDSCFFFFNPHTSKGFEEEKEFVFALKTPLMPGTQATGRKIIKLLHKKNVFITEFHTSRHHFLFVKTVQFQADHCYCFVFCFFFTESWVR